MSLHLSQQEAAELATQLALDFLQRQDTKGWDWLLGGVAPDPVDPRKRGRKLATQWIAVVNFSKDRSALDGGGVIKVNIEDGTAEWSDKSP